MRMLQKMLLLNDFFYIKYNDIKCRNRRTISSRELGTALSKMVNSKYTFEIFLVCYQNDTSVHFLDSHFLQRGSVVPS